MREIKFRAWDSENGKMLVVVMDIVVDAEDLSEGLIESSTVFEWPEIYVPMQYTGLKDKNGKEIYEGDILKWSGEGTLWSDQKEVTVIEDIRHPFANVNLYEVIGNIYENPELLK